MPGVRGDAGLRSEMAKDDEDGVTAPPPLKVYTDGSKDLFDKARALAWDLVKSGIVSKEQPDYETVLVEQLMDDLIADPALTLSLVLQLRRVAAMTVSNLTPKDMEPLQVVFLLERADNEFQEQNPYPLRAVCECEIPHEDGEEHQE